MPSRKGRRISFSDMSENGEEENDIDREKFVLEDDNQEFSIRFGMLKLRHTYQTTCCIDLQKISADRLVEAPSFQIMSTSNEFVNFSLFPLHIEGSIAFFKAEVQVRHLPGPFQETCTILETKSSKRFNVVVKGQVLREGQGTPLLRGRVHCTSIAAEEPQTP
eukprot:TRINITY_DN8579_c0_g1_i1.p1 TRINITY_DN8579_c0_g1~~TRINITY_DN8579_c0_g1_i1.p1  ORF type:complete len:163 (+),score=15.62 TRINITY_DN8579_c0_g1_i1:34-522(+)